MFLALWILAASGATLIVTNGAIFARARNLIPAGFWRSGITCPMCVGFWMGFFLSLTWVSPSSIESIASIAATPAAGALVHKIFGAWIDGCVASIASATLVLVWTTLRELGPAIGLWTHLHYPKPAEQNEHK
jgi:hypothetical protein